MKKEISNGNNAKKTLYKWFSIFAVLMKLQNITAFVVGLTDNIMAVSLGEIAMSGVSVSNQIQPRVMTSGSRCYSW